jgi:hypothetical protein
MSSFTSSSATSVFIVARNDNPINSWSIVNTVYFSQIFEAFSTLRYHLSFQNNSTPGVTLYAGYNGFNGNSSIVGAGVNAIIGFSASSTSTLVAVNGTSNSYSGVSLPNANNATTTFQFGDGRQTTNVNNIVIYEMVGFNTQLSTAEQQQVEGYLAWKWGLQTSLPTNHPYYNSPPTKSNLIPNNNYQLYSSVINANIFTKALTLIPTGNSNNEGVTRNSSSLRRSFFKCNL